VGYGIGYAATPSSFAAAVQRYGSGDVQLITLSGADGDLVPTYQGLLPLPRQRSATVARSSSRSPATSNRHGFNT
jgi:hypothetical protein